MDAEYPRLLFLDPLATLAQTGSKLLAGGKQLSISMVEQVAQTGAEQIYRDAPLIRRADKCL